MVFLRVYPIPDVTESHWAAGAIHLINQAGIMIGYPDGSFGPNDFVTRAQAVTIMNRLLGREPYDVVTHSTWPDVSPKHWAIGHIEEASNGHFFMYGDHDKEEIRFDQ